MAILKELEDIDLVITYGDVNSTAGAAMAARAMNIPIAHVEAGLRSFDQTMPEETNRILVDELSRWHFIHSPEAEKNLLDEGEDQETIFFVGNTMIDSLVRLRDQADFSIVEKFSSMIKPGNYLLVTLHRPALVDDPVLMGMAYDCLNQISEEIPVIFPAHPRTTDGMLKSYSSLSRGPHMHVIPPLDYLTFLGLQMGAKAVLTDSGGVQEETTYLGVPCFTMRDNTERPITTKFGTNTLMGKHPSAIMEIPDLLRYPMKQHIVPPLWDGGAAQRIMFVLEEPQNWG